MLVFCIEREYPGSNTAGFFFIKNHVRQLTCQLRSLHFVKLPLPQVDGLSLDAEATKKAPDMVQEPFIQVLESLDPVWIFYDFAHYWNSLPINQMVSEKVF